MGMIKPPFWSYFELPLQENERLILYPRQLMLLSSIQLNSLLQWQFQWDWIFSRGFYPLQHMVNNGCYLLSVILTHVQKLLEISKPPTTPKSDTYNNTVTDPLPAHDKKCLTTSEACLSTDNIFFDSDTDLLYLDTCATDSMSPYLQDFVPGTFTPLHDLPDVKGSGGSLQIKGYDTVRYSVVSDDGHSYVIEIPDTAYIPTLDYRLLAPQYLKKVERLQGLVDHEGNFTTGFNVDETYSILRYNGGKHSITIQHIPSARVPAMPINRGTQTCQAFCTEIDKVFFQIRINNAMQCRLEPLILMMNPTVLAMLKTLL